MSADDDDRTLEHNPKERWGDGLTGWRKWRKGFFVHKLYRDVWLFVITVLVLFALQANSDRVDDIQRERADSIRRSCDETNQRNIDTKHRLDQLIDAIPSENAEERAALVRSQAFTVALIDALVPVRDCDALAEKSVSTFTAGDNGGG